MLIPSEYERSFAGAKMQGILTAVAPAGLLKHLRATGTRISEIKFFVVSCCDGHQLIDITSQTERYCEQALADIGLEGAENICLHWKTANGGPFALSVPALTVRQYRGKPDHVDRNILAEFEESRDLKKLDMVLLIAHAQCGKAGPHFRTFEDYLRYAVIAKRRFMEEFRLPCSQVITQLQVRSANGRRTYHLDYGRATQLAA